MGFIGAIVAYRLQRGPQPLTRQEASDMLWTLVVILVVLWALGLAFKVASGLIHLLLVIALIVIVFRLISGRRVV
jgi:multisubunit Na+/H+ antiporter MnhF subunit